MFKWLTSLFSNRSEIEIIVNHPCYPYPAAPNINPIHEFSEWTINWLEQNDNTNNRTLKLMRETLNIYINNIEKDYEHDESDIIILSQLKDILYFHKKIVCGA